MPMCPFSNDKAYYIGFKMPVDPSSYEMPLLCSKMFDGLEPFSYDEVIMF